MVDWKNSPSLGCLKIQSRAQEYTRFPAVLLLLSAVSLRRAREKRRECISAYPLPWVSHAYVGETILGLQYSARVQSAKFSAHYPR